MTEAGIPSRTVCNPPINQAVEGEFGKGIKVGLEISLALHPGILPSSPESLKERRSVRSVGLDSPMSPMGHARRRALSATWSVRQGLNS